jgi:hypothetical protein
MVQVCVFKAIPLTVEKNCREKGTKIILQKFWGFRSEFLIQKV